MHSHAWQRIPMRGGGGGTPTRGRAGPQGDSSYDPAQVSESIRSLDRGSPLGLPAHRYAGNQATWEPGELVAIAPSPHLPFPPSPHLSAAASLRRCGSPASLETF